MVLMLNVLLVGVIGPLPVAASCGAGADLAMHDARRKARYSTHPRAVFSRWIAGSGGRALSAPQLRRQILEALGDVGEIMLGLEVARLLRPVLVGAGDIGRLHPVLGGADEVVVVR